MCRGTSFTEFGNFAYFATPQMLQVLNDSRVVQVDVTYPEIKSFNYLCNFAAFNYETLTFQTVFRALMSSVSAKAYQEVFRQCFRVTTNIYPDFNNGEDVRGWLVDYSTAQRKGLESNLGFELAAERIRGCENHWKLNSRKMGEKANKDKKSLRLFKDIAYAIPALEEKSDVLLAFQVLCGNEELQSEKSTDLLSKIPIKSPVPDLSVIDTSDWSKAINFVKWWTNPNIVRMFSVAFTGMSRAEWESMDKTTNPVENENKESHFKTKSFIGSVTFLYKHDKIDAYKTLAVRSGIIVGIPPEERKENNEKRKERKRRPEIVEDKSVAATEENVQQPPAKRGRGRPKKVQAVPAEENDQSELEVPVGSSTLPDSLVGKDIWVKPYSQRGRSLDWKKAKIVAAIGDGSFTASVEREVV